MTDTWVYLLLSCVLVFSHWLAWYLGGAMKRVRIEREGEKQVNLALMKMLEKREEDEKTIDRLQHIVSEYDGPKRLVRSKQISDVSKISNVSKTGAGERPGDGNGSD